MNADHEKAIEIAFVRRRPHSVFWRFPEFFPTQWVAGWCEYYWEAIR
jgi:hypothetical protein